MKRQCAKLRQVLPSGAGRRLAGHAPGAVHPWSTVFGAPVTGAVADTRLVGELEQKIRRGHSSADFQAFKFSDFRWTRCDSLSPRPACSGP